ncbi:MAG: ABC transporter ATP-binding protein [Bacillota bacterium]|nr:ABC transporter ATP-binding protein [Bacillota bacterium]
MLTFEGVTKSFGTVRAVDNLTLSVPGGQIFGFLGPNGAGKTTSVKLAVGLLLPDSGRVSIGDHDVAREPERSKSLIGYVPDRAFLYPKLTGREHLRFLAAVYQLPGPREERVQKWLDLMQLSEAADSPCDSYSHGMRNKLAWAGALIHDPQVLFLDEPTEGLDPSSARLVKDLLRLLKDRGRTVFLCTHIMELAQALCDRVGIIAKGKLLAEGSLAQLRAMSVAGASSLEDVFLELTGSHPAELSGIVEALVGGDRSERPV